MTETKITNKHVHAHAYSNLKSTNIKKACKIRQTVSRNSITKGIPARQNSDTDSALCALRNTAKCHNVTNFVLITVTNKY